MRKKTTVTYLCVTCGKPKERNRPPKIFLPRVWSTACRSPQCGGTKTQHYPALRPLSGEYAG